MIDYAENLCEAMKIIFDKEIKQLAFDITIDATVEDASKAENGIYTVSHDGATFIAYSTDTSFKEKDVVMVTVPQGNYDNQKMIIGKQVDKDKEEKPITYQSPFSQITNLSGNLIYGNIGEEGLLANGGIGKQNIEEREAAQKIPIISFGEGEQVPLSEEYQSNGYTRIGLRADFSTWLNEFNVVSGSYGLILTLKFKNPDAINTNESIITAIYTFDSSEFFGDIYNFETYYNQEAIFDISDYSNYPIQSIKLEAYQKDNFKVSDGSYLSYENEFFDNSFKPSDNIFIKDPFICLGTAVGEFKKDTANIMTTSASIYNNSDNPNNDIKNLKLKWTHQDLNSKDIYVVQEDEIPTNYEIRWYKFKLGASSPDKFMDAHWVRFYGRKLEANEYGDYCLTQEEINNNEALDIATNKINVNFQPNRNNQTEQIRVVILRKDENNNELFVAQTPIITFNNNEQVPVDVNYIDVNALGIQFTDSERGKYYYYDKTGKIFYGEKSKEERTLQAVFSSYTNLENKQELKTLDKQTYTSIKWIFPKDFTMIIPILPDGKTINELKKELGLQKFDGKTTYNKDTENNIYYGYRIEENDSTYEIFFDSSISDMYNSDAIESALTQMKYKIDENFSFNKSRNTVYLETEINGQKYVSSATMFFGTTGTSGSDYTIIVRWGESGQELPIFKIGSNEDLKGAVQLDLKGELVALNENARYEYSFYQLEKEDSGLTIIVNEDNNDNPLGNNNSIFKLRQKSDSSVNINDLYILEVKLTNFGDYDLISRYPIALEQKNDSIAIRGMTGTTMVRYASDGTITKNDKDPYSIELQQYWGDHWQSIDDRQSGYWKIITKDGENNSNFLPKLVEMNEANTTIEAFVFLLKEIIIKDEETLLDFLLSITPEAEEETSDSYKQSITALKENIQNNIEALSQGSNALIEEEDFKTYLSVIDKNELNQLFLILEKKYDKFSPAFFKKIKPILSPPSIYFKDTPLYGVQYNLSNNSAGAIYTQPIYVYQDNYPSTTINQWNGRDLILDEDKGTIVANGFSAGKKIGNDFYGVMIGDWSNTDADEVITTKTGIYGFHQGAMSYAFTDDGKAFIGRDGYGRIEFDGNEGTIESANFNLAEQNGAQLNFTKGSLYLFGQKEEVSFEETYSLVLNSNPNNNINAIFSIGRDSPFQKYASNQLDIYKQAIRQAEQEHKKLFEFLEQLDNIRSAIYKIYSNDNNLPAIDDQIYSFGYFIENFLRGTYYDNDKQGLKDAPYDKRELIPNLIFDFNNFKDVLSPFLSSGSENEKYYYNGTELSSDRKLHNKSTIEYNDYFRGIDLLPDKIMTYLINEYIYYLYNTYNTDKSNRTILINQINSLYKEGKSYFNSNDFTGFKKEKQPSGGTYKIELTFEGEDPEYYPFKKRSNTSNFYDIDHFIRYPNNAPIKKISIVDNNNQLIKDNVINVNNLKYCTSYYIELNDKDQNNIKIEFDQNTSQTKLTEIRDILQEKYFLKNIENKTTTFLNLIKKISQEAYIFIKINNTERAIQYNIYTYQWPFHMDETENLLNFCLIPNAEQFYDEYELQFNKESDFLSTLSFDNDYIFPSNYQNDLIFINKLGGYLTSKNYRPTIGLYKDSSSSLYIRKPTDNQKWSSQDNNYGLKGFIIDLTNDRIVLGNNSSIIGYQSDNQHKEPNDLTEHGLRQFQISTGGTYEKAQSGKLEKLSTNSQNDKAYFIKAGGCIGNGDNDYEDLFTVKWNGDVYIYNNLTVRNIKYTENFYFNSNQIKQATLEDLPYGAQILYY